MYGWFLEQAPAGIVVVVDPRASTCPVQDGTLAAYAMMLAAHSLGLGTCWINPSWNDNELKEILGAPRDMQVICALSLGYPAEAPAKMRRRLEDIVSRERWGNK